MKAMLLTAGLGRRMYPFTLSRPKPVIPVLGRPLVVQILNWLALQGVTEAVLNLHHLPEAIELLVGTGGSASLPIVHYTRETEILGTAGALRLATPLLRGDSIVVCNSDFLSDIDLVNAVARHRASRCAATLVLAPWRPGFSKVAVDAEDRVLSLAGHPGCDPRRVVGEHLFTGCQIINEEVLDRIPTVGPSDIVRDVYQALAAAGRLGSCAHEGFWWEFGSPELYLEGSLKLLAAPAERLRGISAEHDAVRNLGDSLAAVGPGAEIHPSARFRGGVALGYSCNICADAEIEDSVIMPEAWIGPDCRLHRSVVCPGVELPAGFAADSAMICFDSSPADPVPASTRRVEGLLVHSFGEPAG